MLKEYGKEVPRDIKLIGYDDIFIASIVEPSLSTIHIKKKHAGIEAAKIRSDRIENPGNCESVNKVLMDGRLVVRNQRWRLRRKTGFSQNGNKRGQWLITPSYLIILSLFLIYRLLQGQELSLKWPSFRLPAHFIKINWCGKSNHIRKQHFLYNWISVVMDGAAAGLLAGQEAFNLWSLSQFISEYI